MARRTPSELNLLLAIDKPVGCTSHDIVGRVRRAVGERRVGHAGTLDPLASGVMVVGIGQATRLLGMITLDRKQYVARVMFGSETTTDDAEGEVTRAVEPVADLYESDFARRALSRFIGVQDQVPPAYSAISVNGVRSYKLARSGEEVDLPARSIEVYGADLISIDTLDGVPVWTVAFDVSKGTYIRSLARDLGRSVGGAAHLCDLRRTASGCINASMCLEVDDVTSDVARERCLDPVRVLGLSAIEITDGQLADVLCGKLLRTDFPHHVERFALLNRGELRAIAVPQEGRLRMTDVFPQGIEGAHLQ